MSERRAGLYAYTHMGRPIEDLTRDELLDALRSAIDNLERDRSFQIEADRTTELLNEACKPFWKGDSR